MTLNCIKGWSNSLIIREIWTKQKPTQDTILSPIRLATFQKCVNLFYWWRVKETAKFIQSWWARKCLILMEKNLAISRPTVHVLRHVWLDPAVSHLGVSSNDTLAKTGPGRMHKAVHFHHIYSKRLETTQIHINRGLIE